MTNRNNGGTTAGRDDTGRFTTGNPGRPPGARHKATQAALTLLDGEADALTRKVVDLALEGDTTALRLCLERIAPPRKDAPVTFDLPSMLGAADAAKAAGAVLENVALGELTPTEGAHVMALIETYRRTLEISIWIITTSAPVVKCWPSLPAVLRSRCPNHSLRWTATM